MLVNADLSKPAIVLPDQYAWVVSPQSGVERVMLDRIGGEIARATSIVRYRPGSFFPRHEHPGGEEILVLSGTFSEGDEHHGPGCYLRNPPGSAHQPSSADGAVIFVKLCQMPADEQDRVRIDTRDPGAWRRDDGREVCPLFSGPAEKVGLQRLVRGQALAVDATGGAEVLVLEGQLVDGSQAFARGSWIRVPPGGRPASVAGAGGATVYLKTGHLTGRTGSAAAAGPA